MKFLWPAHDMVKNVDLSNNNGFPAINALFVLLRKNLSSILLHDFWKKRMNYNDIFRGKDIYSNLFIIPLLGKHQNMNVGILKSSTSL